MIFVRWLGKYLSREFILTAAGLWLTYNLAITDKLTTEWIAALGTIVAFLGGRTIQKRNGG
ncbi:MAG: hypothetical protein ACE5DQ_02195 [Candidatus Paceibacterota bacterium]